jgi:hypothetical protein
MQRFRYQDFPWVEKTPTSPAALEHRITDLLYNSTTCRCKVEAANSQTGEYRIVLQGTLDWDWEEPKPKNQ